MTNSSAAPSADPFRRGWPDGRPLRTGPVLCCGQAAVGTERGQSGGPPLGQRHPGSAGRAALAAPGGAGPGGVAAPLLRG